MKTGTYNPLVVKSGDVTVEEEIEKNLFEKGELSPVWSLDYIPGDSESPVGNLGEFQGCNLSAESCTSGLSLTSPVALFQSIEFVFIVPLRPISSQKQLAKTDYDPDDQAPLISGKNNLLGLNRDFHDLFDGKMTYDVVDTVDVPMIAIKPPEERDNFQEEVVCGSPPLKRKQV